MAEPMKGTRRIKWGVAALTLCVILFIASVAIGYPASVLYIIGAISVVAMIAIARGLSERER